MSVVHSIMDTSWKESAMEKAPSNTPMATSTAACGRMGRSMAREHMSTAQQSTKSLEIGKMVKLCQASGHLPTEHTTSEASRSRNPLAMAFGSFPIKLVWRVPTHSKLCQL